MDGSRSMQFKRRRAVPNSGSSPDGLILASMARLPASWTNALLLATWIILTLAIGFHLLKQSFFIGAAADVKAESPAVLLFNLWSQSLQNQDAVDSNLPQAPHLEDCKKRSQDYARMDSRSQDGKRPRWTTWKGVMGLELGDEVSAGDEGEDMLLNTNPLVEGPYPPWVHGGDDDNLPMTRRAQRDIWLNQHPANCSHSSVRFLLADWIISLPLSPATTLRLGVGAELTAMAGMLAVAINERRVLVTNYYHRADHEGCTGLGNSSWSCYFVPEASKECIDRAKELALQGSAWKEGIITSNKDYHGWIHWVAKIPDLWGEPWKYIQRTVEIDGDLLGHHNAEEPRWWRAQAVQYLTRLPSEYLCTLLNQARHQAFGAQAAKLVVKSLPADWPKVPAATRNEPPIEKFVWKSYGPWVPRPLVSLHVRQGDKAGEMKIFNFKAYMDLAQKLRDRFPDIQSIWLSTEMQNVIDETRNYTGWNFYFTNIPRQTGTTSMFEYESSIGRLNSSSNALVNFLMAAECDYFVGALGSSWSYLIDGMRATSGKVMAGFLSVNRDRFW